MAETIFFQTVPGGIEMLSRAAGPGMIVGDSREVITPQTKLQWPKGLTYAALAKAKGGKIEVADSGSFKIVPSSN